MAFLDVVFRALNKAGDAFVELRREDGHGSTAVAPTHVQDAQIVDVLTVLNKIDQNTDTLEISAESINLNTDTLEAGQASIVSELVLIKGNQLPDNHLVTVSNFPAIQAVDTGLDQPLTDTQLRAAPVEVTGNLTITPPDLQQVADDYQAGEILPDQSGNGGVLTFTFAASVQNIWVYAVNPLDLTATGEVRVDPFGGTPSASTGIPVSYGGGFPIPIVTSSVKVFAPVGSRVTIYGNRRA